MSWKQRFGYWTTACAVVIALGLGLSWDWRSGLSYWFGGMIAMHLIYKEDK